MNDANGRALKQALREANGRASENVLTCGCDIQHLATSFEAHLDELRIPETEREGIVVRWRRPGPGRAYRATMIVSDVQLLRGAETWYLHDVSRATVVPETPGIEQIRVAPDRLAMFGALLHPAFVPAPEEATDA